MRKTALAVVAVSLAVAPAARAADQEQNKKVKRVFADWDVIQPIPEKAANTNGMF
jgi:hypothetical protein